MAVIREMYNGLDAQELFETELDKAIEAGIDVIVIEPRRLGEETARWIGFGSCLSQTAFVAGTGSILTSFLCRHKPLVYCPLSGLSLFCAAFYNFSWKSDPCSKYRTCTDEERRNPFVQNVAPSIPSPPVILIKRSDNGSATLIHSAIALLALAVSAFNLFKWLNYDPLNADL